MKPTSQAYQRYYTRWQESKLAFEQALQGAEDQVERDQLWEFEAPKVAMAAALAKAASEVENEWRYERDPDDSGERGDN